MLVYDVRSTSEQLVRYAIRSWGFVVHQVLYGVPKRGAGGNQVPGV